MAGMVTLLPVDRRVPHGALSRLEPCAVKVARTVLRGLGGGNVTQLPDYPEPTPGGLTGGVPITSVTVRRPIAADQPGPRDRLPSPRSGRWGSQTKSRRAYEEQLLVRLLPMAAWCYKAAVVR